MNVEDWVTNKNTLQHPDLAGASASIVASEEVNGPLLSKAMPALRLRGELDFNTTSLHGMSLLGGPPGTGRIVKADASKAGAQTGRIRHGVAKMKSRLSKGVQDICAALSGGIALITDRAEEVA